MLSVAEARLKILETIVPLGTEKIPLLQANSSILAQDVVADRPFPPFNRVAMDGYAVRSIDFVSDITHLKPIGQIQAGKPSDLVVRVGEAVHIMTGSPLPEGADAVVKIEHCTLRNNDTVIICDDQVKAWLNVARVGEDAAQGDTLLAKGTTLTSAGIAVCASVGVSEVLVYQKPTLKVVSTGTEIIPPEETPLPHQIRDCNSFSVGSLSQASGVTTEFLGICDDNPELLKKKMQAGLEADIFILSGGVSMGEFDLVPGLLTELGVKKIFHKVRLRPGKPIWYGVSEQGTYVFGLPGNPVSVQVNFKLFVEPAILKLMGSRVCEPQFLHLPLDDKIIKYNMLEQYFPAKLTFTEGKTSVKSILIRGSGDFSNLAYSDGLICCPVDYVKLEPQAIVKFLPWRSL